MVSIPVFSKVAAFTRSAFCARKCSSKVGIFSKTGVLKSVTRSDNKERLFVYKTKGLSYPIVFKPEVKNHY